MVGYEGDAVEESHEPPYSGDLTSVDSAGKGTKQASVIPPAPTSAQIEKSM